MSVRILYRDAHLLVCEKPVGVSSESPGLPDLAAEETGARVWPVHRLDQGTGGAVVFALSRTSCSSLQKLFLQDQVEKEYLAVVSGRPQGSSGCYADLLFHDRRTNRTFVVDRIRAGVRKASCEWEFAGSAVYEGRELSLVRVCLHTGRTHQIRVQFASRGLPLVGDGKYGSRIKAGAPALWASRVSFPHPLIKGAAVNAVSLPPPVFPWNLFSFSG